MTKANVYVYMYIYIHTYTHSYTRAQTCRGETGTRGLEAQFCSVNLWRRAKGVYHSRIGIRCSTPGYASTSIFRTQPRARFYLTFPRSPPSSSFFLPPFPRVRGAIYLHNIRGGHGGRGRKGREGCSTYAFSRSRPRNPAQIGEIARDSIARMMKLLKNKSS